MEKKRGVTIAVVAALVIAVISLGVAFAAFSTTLNINGTATVQATKWDIYFSNSAYSSQSSSKPSSSTPIASITPSNGAGFTTTASGTGNITSATTIEWSASFKTAGDRVTYAFYVVNDGDFNATLDSTGTSGLTQVGVTNFTCTAEGGQTGAEESVCAHIHYGIYTDSAGTTPLQTGTSLNAHSSNQYYLVAWLDNSYGGNDGQSLAPVDVTTATITTTLAYTQSSSAVSNN